MTFIKRISPALLVLMLFLLFLPLFVPHEFSVLPDWWYQMGAYGLIGVLLLALAAVVILLTLMYWAVLIGAVYYGGKLLLTSYRTRADPWFTAFKGAALLFGAFAIFGLGVHLHEVFISGPAPKHFYFC